MIGLVVWVLVTSDPKAYAGLSRPAAVFFSERACLAHAKDYDKRGEHVRHECVAAPLRQVEIEA